MSIDSSRFQEQQLFSDEWGKQDDSIAVAVVGENQETIQDRVAGFASSIKGGPMGLITVVVSALLDQDSFIQLSAGQFISRSVRNKAGERWVE
ncbi:hypothetical protein BG011_009217, partial [Mortierella polycephala]